MIENLVFILKEVSLAIVVSIGTFFYIFMFVIADELSKIEFFKFLVNRRRKKNE